MQIKKLIKILYIIQNKKVIVEFGKIDAIQKIKTESKTLIGYYNIFTLFKRTG